MGFGIGYGGSSGGSSTTNAADLTEGVLADARVQESNVTQHEGALTITTSQISDVTATATELNYVDGVTSSIQTQLSGKVNSTTVGEPSGSDTVSNIVSLTQAEYDAGTPVAGTVYYIIG